MTDSRLEGTRLEAPGSAVPGLDTPRFEGARLDVPRFDVLVEVSLRPGIADPQGATIERALPALGFSSIDGVRVGKAIRFSVHAPDQASAQAQAEELSRRLLSNPVIEDARVEVQPG